MTEVNYQKNWQNNATQCRNCKSFQSKDDKNACVPLDKTFEEALKEYGEVDINGHCDYFQAK